MREVGNAVVLATAPNTNVAAPMWEELTGFSEGEEDAFNRLEGHYPALLAASMTSHGCDSDEEDGAWQHLQ